MGTYELTSKRIAEKVKIAADVLVFRPVSGCKDALLDEICLVIDGRILCILPNTPHEAYRKSFSGSNRYFLGQSLPKEQIINTYKAVQNCRNCIVFASLSMLQQDSFVSFMNENTFSAMLILQAENISPVLSYFDKRLHLVPELRAQLQYTLPVCAFCATDLSAVLRDITAGLSLKTPARVYPGTAAARSKLFSMQTTPPFTAFENRVRQDNIQRALVLCTSRQAAEDAYRYFRFFGYCCALSHGGISYENRSRAVSRFANGEINFLFTTRFSQAGFTLQPYTTAVLGIPTDVYSLYAAACVHEDIFVYYTKEDETESVYKIEADNEIRSRYTNLLPYRLRQERLLLQSQMLDAVQNNIAPFEMLREKYEHIYYEQKEVSE